ncbi:MAG: tripartite tricarboxylate transporter TctB family protein [Hyphomicrobiaceae bacterium]|nr:tripartite tricarboxylate transporter TctB family protein [Hyphomicrobiaceae bacterium]
MAQRFRSTIPYFLGLAAAAVLYALADGISYTARPGQLGPDTWPLAAIAIIAVVCVYEIVRRLLVAGSVGSEVQGIAEHLDSDELDATAAEAKAGSRTYMLLAGMALTLAYAVVVQKLGFLLASYLFLILFMYLGGIRNHVAIWASSTIGMLLFAFIFLKVVYVSIPRGEPPFDQVTQLVMDLMQIR